MLKLKFSEELDDEDQIVEYDRDIKLGPIMDKIETLLSREKQPVQEAVELIKIVKFDRNKVVQIDGKEYRVISDKGLETISKFEFPGLKKKYNILPHMFGCRDNPGIIEFTNSQRNFFAIWAFAAIHIDHTQFTKFLYHTVLSYKVQRGEIDEVSPFRMSDIEPMTYAKFLYEVGLSMLKFNARLYNMNKRDNKQGIQSEHIIEAFYY